MSKQTTASKNLQPRVSGGVPWWIWGFLIVVGGGIIFAFLQRAISKDPAVLFAEAITAAEKRERPETIREKAEELKAFPEFERHQKLLDGLLLLGTSRPLKAIPLLQAASEEKSIRSRALSLLGAAYGQAENLPMAVVTFETALSEDENANDARRNLASIFTQLTAWNEAIAQLDILLEKKFQPAIVHKMRADLRFDLEQFAEAADDYEASILANKNDPENGLKASQLVRCLIKTKQFDRAEPFITQLDQPGASDAFQAEKLFEKGLFKELPGVLDRIREATPNDATANLIYGRMMLQQNSPERAQEAMVLLRPVIRVLTRNVELYRVVAALAKLAGDEQLAGLVQQNVDQLDVLEKQYQDQLAAVIKTRDGFEERLQLGKLAAATGRFELAMKFYSTLGMSFPARTEEIEPYRRGLYEGQPQLVSTVGETASSSPTPETTPAAATESPAVTPAAESAPPTGAAPAEAPKP